MAAKLIVKYTDGSEAVIETDESWKATSSFFIENSIYDNETRDDTRNVQNVVACSIENVDYKPIPDFGALVVNKAELKPTLYISPKNEKTLDFHQYFVGL